MGDNYPFTSVDDGGPISGERLAEIREQAEYCSIAVEAEELLWLLGQADEAKRLRAENTALRAEATSAWSEGSAHALGQVLDHEDQFRADLGVLLVAEERRCQLAINEEDRIREAVARAQAGHGQVYIMDPRALAESLHGKGYAHTAEDCNLCESARDGGESHG